MAKVFYCEDLGSGVVRLLPPPYGIVDVKVLTYSQFKHLDTEGDELVRCSNVFEARKRARTECPDSSQAVPLPYPYNDSNKFLAVESARGKKVSSVLPFQSSKFKLLYVCRERQGEFVPSARMAELSGVALDSTRSLLSSWMRFPASRRYVCRRPLAVSGSLQYGYALKWAGYHFLKTLESKRPMWVSIWLSELPAR